MNERTTVDPTIALEMSPKSKIGCAIAFLIFVLIVVALMMVLRASGSKSANASTIKIFSMAQARDYKGLESWTTASALQTLQKAETVDGPISAFQVLEVSTGLTGRPATVTVETTRGGKPYIDVVAMIDSVHAAVIIEYPKDDWEHGREDRAVRVIAK